MDTAHPSSSSANRSCSSQQSQTVYGKVQFSRYDFISCVGCTAVMILCIVVVCASTGGQPLVGCTEIYGTVNSGRLC